jgi:transcriptional regulator with AAA-type ATPase domain
MKIVYVDDVDDYVGVVQIACKSIERWLKRSVSFRWITIGKSRTGLLWLKAGKECAADEIDKELSGTRCVPSKADIDQTLVDPDTIYLLDLEFHNVYLKTYGFDLGLYLVSRGVPRDRIVLFTAWAGRVFEQFKDEVGKGDGAPPMSFFPYEKEALGGDPQTMGERLAWKLIELRPAVLVPAGKPRTKSSATQMPEGVIGVSNQLQHVVEQCRRAISIDKPVLITGETGTGKELVARLIHRLSSRARGPFVAVNCAALPDNLVESELFGYEKGAFTGAAQQKLGGIEIADGGVLFLDEIGDLSLVTQAKLLRVLQDHKLTRLGATKEREIDFLLLSATNKDLRALVRDGAFREDLFYRISVLEIPLPPLRDRREDILPLAKHFLAKGYPSASFSFTQEAERLLLDARWEGNARELENAILRAAVSTDDAIITPAAMQKAIRAANVGRKSAKGDKFSGDIWTQWLEVVQRLKGRMNIQRNVMSAFSAALRNLPDGDLDASNETVGLIWDVLVAAVRQMCEKPEDVRRTRLEGDYGLPIVKLASLLDSLNLKQQTKEVLVDAVNHPLPNWGDFKFSGEANPRDWDEKKKERVIRVADAMAKSNQWRR